MDGLELLVLLALPGQAMISGLADFGVLAAAVALFMLSALALVRQILAAIFVGD